MELRGNNQVLYIQEITRNRPTNHRVQPDNDNCFNFTQSFMSNDVSLVSSTFQYGNKYPTTILLLPSFWSCYHSAPTTILLLLLFCFGYHSVPATILLLLPFCSFHHSALLPFLTSYHCSSYGSASTILLLLLLMPTAIWVLLILQRFESNKIRSKACVHNFLFFHQMIALEKLWKIVVISSKKLFSFSRYSIFCNFFLSIPHFPDSRRQIILE